MRCKRLLFLIFSFSSFGARAQLTIRGQVTETSAKPLASVTVQLSSQLHKQKATQTDSAGFYGFKQLPPGHYQVVFTALNFVRVQNLILLKNDTSWNVQLVPALQQLKEVDVAFRKSRIEKKAGKTIFYAENSLAAMGSDALELLAKIPGVRVLNEKVSLVGRAGINILVDDKLIPLSGDDLSAYLKSISADRISKVEVVTNPGAKYDAQGNSGLINIVLKKNVNEGFNASVNAMFTEASYGTFAGGGNVNYRNGKLSLYGNFNVRKGSLVPFEQGTVFYPEQTWNIVNKDRNYRTVPSGQLGMDYQLNRKTAGGLSYGTGHTSFHSEENIRTTVLGRIQQIDSVLNSDAAARIKSDYYTANAYLKHTLNDGGGQLVFNADWFRFKDQKARFFNHTAYTQYDEYVPQSFSEYLSASAQQINLYTFKMDADLPLEFAKLSAGAKLSFIDNASDISFYKKVKALYESDPGQHNIFSYTEYTQALYAALSKKTKQWDFQLGLRGEYTQTKGLSAGENNRNDYFKLFPTLFITHTLSEQHVLSFSYGKRINRPAYKKLNPFRWYSNPYAYAEGNPFLQPSYNQNLELSHTYAGVLTNALSLSKTSNGFNDVNFTDAGTKVQVSRPVNFLTGYRYQFSSSLVFNRLKNWEANAQADVYYTHFNTALPDVQTGLNGFGAYVSASNQFTLNKAKTFFTELNFWYQFAGVEGLNDTEPLYNLDLGAKMLFLKKKLQAGIQATDVLHSNRQRYSSSLNNIRQVYNNYYDSRQLKLSIRYAFGNEKLKQVNRRAGNEEERKRSN